MTPAPGQRVRLHARSAAAFSGWCVADVVRVLEAGGASVVYRTPSGTEREVSRAEWEAWRPEMSAWQ